MKNIEEFYKYSQEWRSSKLYANYLSKEKEDNVVYNDPIYFLELNEIEQCLLLDWIKNRVRPNLKFNLVYRNNILLQIYLRNMGGYITAGMFMGAMIVSGYFPIERYSFNPHYAIKYIRN